MITELNSGPVTQEEIDEFLRTHTVGVDPMPDRLAEHAMKLLDGHVARAQELSRYMKTGILPHED